jgi:site-specific DNA recombinase
MSEQKFRQASRAGCRSEVDGDGDQAGYVNKLSRKVHLQGERIRDKIAASKRKGMWMGGLVPIGYEVRERQLIVVESEAATVRRIFQRYCELGNVRLLKEDLDRNGYRSKLRISSNGVRSGDKSFARGALYTLLRNPIYIGEIRHQGARYPGQHQPIVECAVWEKTQELLLAHTVRTKSKPRESPSSPLIGKLFDEAGERLTPSHAVKGNRRYRYYVSRSLLKGGAHASGQGWRVPALELERNRHRGRQDPRRAHGDRR